MINIVIVDYGIGNITSIVNMLKNFKGIKIELSSNPKTIKSCDKLILPGVGAFGNAMQNINSLNLHHIINDYIKKGNSLLGICLGMQLLMDSSEEFGYNKGLGLISGEVKKISEKKNIILPNVGFYKPSIVKMESENKIKDDWFYFVHSFKCVPKIENNIISKIIYNSIPIVSEIRRDNIHGCQFHPEKSHKSGIEYYKKFINE
tara:strand:- start:374 stop:985 length:612 start_codon:yes stop_codon:yes gene_type:complete